MPCPSGNGGLAVAGRESGRSSGYPQAFSLNFPPKCYYAATSARFHPLYSLVPQPFPLNFTLYIPLLIKYTFPYN
jgi:hypothetical protein